MQLASLTADEPADEFYGRRAPRWRVRLTYDPEHVQPSTTIQLEFSAKHTGQVGRAVLCTMHLCWVDVALSLRTLVPALK